MLITRNIVFLLTLTIIATGCKSENVNIPDIPIKPSSQTAEPKSSPEVSPAKISAPTIVTQQDLKNCMDITAGDVLVSNLPNSPQRDNFYLECTLNPFIGTVKVNASDRDKARTAQSKNAAYLSGKDIDPHYVTTQGLGLLHMIISSDLSQDKKMKWVKRLVEDGANVNYMNEYGNEALRAAKYQNLPHIYGWLVEKGAKP